MISGALLTVFATVLALEGGSAGDRARIDQGLVEGLRPGDRGSLFYLLTVGSDEKRIDLGAVEVIAVDEHSATLGKLQDRPAQPGFRVELELPAERLAPAGIVAAARQLLGEEAARRLARGFLAELVAGDAQLLADSCPHGPAAPAAPTTPAAAPDTVRIPGGRYWIGSDLAGTAFHNETPRFEAALAPFEIDRLPTAPPATGLTWGEAALACAKRGMRLPTELEWEVAARSATLRTGSPALEWTASWYQPYPGNRHPEKEFGERYRVVRGAPAETGAGPRQRRFLSPDQRNPRIGFRCARSPEP